MNAAVLEKTRADIERVGWSAIGVFPAVGDEPTPSFMYTIGLFDLEHPELLIASIPTEFAHSILHEVYDRVKAGERFVDGERYDKVLRDYDVEMRALPPDGRPANVARAYYDVEALPVLQIVWPDKEGRFPGEDGCESSCVTGQDPERLRL